MSLKPPDKPVKGGLTLTIVAPKQATIGEKDLAEDLNISLGKGFTMGSTAEQILENNLKFDLRNIFSLLISNQKLYDKSEKILSFVYEVLKEEGVVDCKIGYSTNNLKKPTCLDLIFSHTGAARHITIHEDIIVFQGNTSYTDLGTAYAAVKEAIRWLVR